MLLAVDVGNTQTVLGLFDGDRLVDNWRVATDRSRTGDELVVLLGGLLDPDAVDGICLSTTVPLLLREWERLAGRWAHAPLLAVGPGVRTGIPIRYDDPREVGPDRIVNAVAAKARFGAPVIVVDFGTSTNFDVVSPDGDYVGGVLAPGIETSMDALFARAARLVKVDYVEPPSVIGKTTVAGLQSGLVYGFAGQVDGIVAAIRGELESPDAPVVATGGLAELVATQSSTIGQVDPYLTLEGLRLVWELNRVIPEPETLAVFCLAALALLVVPGPAVLYIVASSIDGGRRAGRRVDARDPDRGARPRLRRGARAVGPPRRVGARVRHRQVPGRRLSHRDRTVDAAPRREPDGCRRGASADALPEAVRAGSRRPDPEPEDGAVLPRVPAAVRRSGGRARRPADAVPRPRLRRARDRLSDGTWVLVAGTASDKLRGHTGFLRAQRWVSGTVFVGLGVATALTGSHRSTTT